MREDQETELRDARMGHGDLQHGNVLLVPGSKEGALALKLIDYDGMWVEALLGNPPGERGHERFPYLLNALADLGLAPPFRSNRLWAFFDSAYRARVDVDAAGLLELLGEEQERRFGGTGHDSSSNRARRRRSCATWTIFCGGSGSSAAGT